MLKKSLIFVSAALFLVALITLTGCPTSVDDDSSSGTVYAHRIYGRNVDPYQAQEAIDRAVAAGEPVVLEDNLDISAAGAVQGALNFKGARVIINGDVTFTNGIVNMVDATVLWADGATLDLGNTQNSGYICREGDLDPGRVAEGDVAWYVDSLARIMPTATKAAVSKFQLGTLQNFDYSTGSPVNARITAEELETLFVLDELIVTGDSRPPTDPPADLAITALGTVDVTGSPAPASNVVLGDARLPLGTSSILTSSIGTVSITVAANGGNVDLPNIEIPSGKTLEIVTGNNNLEIGGKLKGAGTLRIPDAVTGIRIEGGDGNIQFTGNTNLGIAQIGSTGKVTFDQAVSISGVLASPAKIYSEVEFNDSVTIGSVELYGDVTLAATNETVTFAGVNNNTLTLGPGKTISVRIRPTVAGSAITLAPVLAAGPGGVTLQASAAAVALTTPAAPSRVDGVDAAKKLTLNQNLTILNGTLQVASGAIFEVNSVTLTTYIPQPAETTIGYLAVADGGTLGLASANASVDIGQTTISSTSSTITAAGGTVSLGNDKIVGAVAGSKLTVVKGTAAFTVNSGRLTLEQVDLNLIASGSVRTTLAADQVELTKQAKITLKDDAEGVATTRSRIGSANNWAQLDGDFTGLTAATTSTTQAALSITHNGGSPALIKGTVTLSRSGTNFIQ